MRLHFRFKVRSLDVHRGRDPRHPPMLMKPAIGPRALPARKEGGGAQEARGGTRTSQYTAETSSEFDLLSTNFDSQGHATQKGRKHWRLF